MIKNRRQYPWEFPSRINARKLSKCNRRFPSTYAMFDDGEAGLICSKAYWNLITGGNKYRIKRLIKLLNKGIIS